jgi:hypothetical protein
MLRPATAAALAWLLASPAAWGQVQPQPAVADMPVYRHVIEAGDTLIGLGRRLLNDPARWPDVQRLNGVRDPLRLPVGGELRIPLPLMRTEAAPATVAAVRGNVRSADAAVVPGQALPEGSDLATGADGQVTVRLVDGTVLRLRSGTRVRIDESRRVPGADSVRSGVQLEQGRVEVEARPARGGQPGFRIGTPQGVMGVRGTEFRVHADGPNTRSEVLEGAVAARGTATPDEQRVAAGFGTVIDVTGRVAPPSPLLPAPDLSAWPPLLERPLVQVSVPLPPGGAGWRAQVGADDSFDALLADLRTDGAEVRIAGLPDGRFALRLRAVAPNGLEGRDARTTLTLKARPEPPLPLSPAPRAVVTGHQVQLAWAQRSDARRYRLQLARAGADGVPPAQVFQAPLHDVKDVEGQTHTLLSLAPGAYVWRLASVRPDGDQGPFGDAQGFELRAVPPTLAPPAPPAVGDHAIRVFWQGLPGQRFDLQVARDAGFTQLVEQRHTDRTEVELPLPGVGRFFARLRAHGADGVVGPWTDARHFDVVPCVRDGGGACVRVEGGTLRLP